MIQIGDANFQHRSLWDCRRQSAHIPATLHIGQQFGRAMTVQGNKLDILVTKQYVNNVNVISKRPALPSSIDIVRWLRRTLTLDLHDTNLERVA